MSGLSEADHEALIEAVQAGEEAEWLAAYVAAERDRAVREALAPVRALADEWEVDGGAEPFAWRRLRAALPDDREDHA